MPNPAFPTLAAGQDSSMFSVELEDKAMSTPMEGGYVVTRAKHTRAPRKTFTTGYTDISNADKALLDAFYASVSGGSVIFDWVDPSSGMGGDTPVTYAVRFVGPYKPVYKGIGPTRLWTVSFSLQQA